MKKIRLTGFARFFLAMLIIVPLAFFGASYITGGDGMQELKRLLGMETQARQINSNEETAELDPASPQTSEGESAVDRGKVAQMQEELEYLRKRVDELKQEKEELQQEVWEKEQEISRLKQTN